MGLELDFPGVGKPLLASVVSLTRALGEPTQWRFVVELTREERGGRQVEEMARALQAGPVKVRASWRGGGDTALGPEATVVGAQWETHTSVDYVSLEAHATTPEPEPDPFVPRWRVHRATNMNELVKRFAGVARPVRALQAELERVTFPDQDKTSIIQAGISDWEFFAHILDQCRLLSQGTPAWLPLTLVGGVDEDAGTAGRWVLLPGTRAAYDQWGDVAGRTVRFQDDADGVARVEFSRHESVCRVPEFASGISPAVILWRPDRRFDPQRWRRWRTMDLPRFTEDGAFVWRIEDRLRRVAHDALAWETRLFTLPPEAQVPAPVASSPPRSWTGVGTVDDAPAKGPWMRVRLSGFEPGEDTADVRLSTAFSGKDGKKGLHLVPAAATEVSAGWSGRFDASVLLLGNTRTEETVFGAPSLYLEDTYTGQYEDVAIPRIGDVSVASGLSLRVDQQTSVTSARRLAVQADGAELKMAGGIVRTGRGM